MRAALMESWPTLSRLFNIHPWDAGRLSAQELNVYINAALDIADATGP